MSKIKNSGLDQCGAEPFGRQQLGIPSVEGVNTPVQWGATAVPCGRQSSVARSRPC